jgi:cellulose synthase/poly-beta-1,6-N-acetylglucosamine synthase-like glycosyltransferase
MEQTFRTIFPDGLAIRLDKMYQDLSDNEKKEVENIIGNNKYVCVSQPHCGKREIMYTAFHFHTKETEFISLTDSDTLFKPNTITEMVKVIDGYDILQKENPKWRVCGAVTGNVEIWNQ